MKRHPAYPKEVRIQALAMLAKTGNVSEVCKHFKLAKQTLYTWKSADKKEREKKGNGHGHGNGHIEKRETDEVVNVDNLLALESMRLQRMSELESQMANLMRQNQVLRKTLNVLLGDET